MPKLLCSPDAPEWLELRRSGVTASDLPVIMGLVSWDSPWALYHRKRGTLPDVEQTDRMRLGSWLERVIADHWAIRSGYLDATRDHRGGLYQNDERSWQLATPDYAWDDAVLECKTSATRDGWGYGEGSPVLAIAGESEAEREQAYSGVPAYVRAQVLWQMDTLGVARGHVAVVFLPSGEFRSYTIDHSAILKGHEGFCDICADIVAMRERAHEFYRRITGDLGPPPVDHLTVTTKALQEVYAGLDETLQAEIPLDLYDAWATARTIARAADRDAQGFTNMVREAMGKASVAAVNGEPVIRRQVHKRAGYEVAPGIQDKLVKIPARGSDE